MKIELFCETCKKSFHVSPYRKDEARFCSRKCAGVWKRTQTGVNSPAWRGGKISGTCLNCGKGFSRFPAFMRRPNKFCSASCWASYTNRGSKSHLWKGGKRAVNCLRCGKEVQTYGGQEPRKYCSKECYDLVRQKRDTVVCTNCAKPFTRRLSKIARSDKQFCSKLCNYEYSFGSGNPNWLGGVSFFPYPTEFNGKFKRMIRERDGNLCALCHKSGNCVHHIDYNKSNTTAENCVTLCKRCHAITNTHRIYWTSYFADLAQSPVE